MQPPYGDRTSEANLRTDSRVDRVANDFLRGARVLVVGLGRFGGGVGAVRWLVAQGARVTVTDHAPPDTLAESVAAVSDLPVELVLGGHSQVDAGRFDLAVVGPAVRRDSDIFQQIAGSGVPWTTEINLFCERCPAPVVAVTGSYGKSTTCAMMAHGLQACIGRGRLRHRNVFLGGNIGGSLLGDLHGITPSDVVVLELSNAQLEHIPRIDWTPALAIITNIHPHHLDRYASFAEYAQVKLNVLGHPQRAAQLVLGPVHDEVASLVTAGVARISEVRRPGDSYEARLAVPGAHNRGNAGCVLSACELLGLDRDFVAAALADFHGLPHRLELVARIAGVAYINDSKSTAPEATVTALQALHGGSGVGGQVMGSPGRAPTGVCHSDVGQDEPGRIVLILGGQAKPEPLGDLPAEVMRCCRAAICVGECANGYAEAIRSAMRGSPRIGEPTIEIAPSLQEAITSAARHAQRGDTVLFSPGAPSFDAYRNFAERGDHFTSFVRLLG